ncbi:hypothetical protein Bint_1110 [Brachyspira intermedia PWS/A]|uniref:Uncharacterized protein n=1 Tax=Brachyspira intermedia (strain ATCC 51140 / PWS/A) TaxID=1045858 RepID=G0EMP5_BRAIP|nr:hypothetical protein [Brachyspira intermedia]AEM21733.1 hypothetical protein Bint_1110 [Brachyspira intermedia PWS/A]
MEYGYELIYAVEAINEMDQELKKRLKEFIYIAKKILKMILILI